TRRRVPSLTRGLSLITRETVIGETPALTATSRIVTLTSSLLPRGRRSWYRYHGRRTIRMESPLSKPLTAQIGCVKATTLLRYRYHKGVTRPCCFWDMGVHPRRERECAFLVGQ